MHLEGFENTINHKGLQKYAACSWHAYVLSIGEMYMVWFHLQLMFTHLPKKLIQCNCNFVLVCIMLQITSQDHAVINHQWTCFLRWETAIYYRWPRQRINPSLKFQRQAAMDLVAWRDQTPKNYRAWMSSRRTQTQPPHPCHWSQCNRFEDDPIELQQDPKSLTLSEQLPCQPWRWVITGRIVHNFRVLLHNDCFASISIVVSFPSPHVLYFMRPSCCGVFEKGPNF